MFQLSQGHRIVVLQGMEAVLQDKASEIEKDLAKDITRTAVHELTAVKVNISMPFLKYYNSLVFILEEIVSKATVSQTVILIMYYWKDCIVHMQDCLWVHPPAIITS